jgi:hypothetical protein
MKEKIYNLTDVTFTLSSPNRATLSATGEASTPGWTELELGNQRIGDGTIHLDFLGAPPAGNVIQVLTPAAAQRTMLLGPQPQSVTVHSASNDMSIQLPAAGDPK